MTPEHHTTGRPRYEQFERRDARLRPEQWRAIEDLAKRIKRGRRDRRERITASTVLRLAVDYLLAHENGLTGETEAELRTCLGLPDPDHP